MFFHWNIIEEGSWLSKVLYNNTVVFVTNGLYERLVGEDIVTQSWNIACWDSVKSDEDYVWYC